MKKNTLVIIISIISLIIIAPYGNAAIVETTVVIPDTLPELIDDLSQDLMDEDADFKSIEDELESLDGGLKSNDTTKIRIGKMKIAVIEDGKDIIINNQDDWDNDDWDEDWTWNDSDNWTFHRKGDSDKFKPHWAGFAMGLNNYVTSDNKTTLPTEWQLLEVNTNNSLEVNLNFAQIGLNIVKQRIGIVTGVGTKWNNYKFRNPNTVLSMESNVLSVSDTNDFNGQMSKLTTWYLVVPLLIEFQLPTAHGDDFYLSAGVEGGVKLLAHTKIKTDTKSKFKDKNDFFTNSLDYRLTARLGYGHFGIYGTYSMVPLFAKDKGPELYPIAVGVSLNF